MQEFATLRGMNDEKDGVVYVAADPDGLTTAWFHQDLRTTVSDLRGTPTEILDQIAALSGRCGTWDVCVEMNQLGYAFVEALRNRHPALTVTSVVRKRARHVSA